MREKRSAHRFKPTVQSEVEIVFEGATKISGQLRDTSQYSTYVYAEGIKPDISKCFLRLQVSGHEHYSRGEVIRKEDKGIVLRLENWFPVFSDLAKQDILAKNSTLKQILQLNKNKKVLDEVEKEFIEQRKPNCWEVVNCNKESFCPAGIKVEYDGLLGGTNGGRFCAFIPETFCKDGLPRNTQKKMELCADCNFYQDILQEALPDTQSQKS